MAVETPADLEATTYDTVDALKTAAVARGGAVAAAIADLSDEEILAGLEARTLDIDTLPWIGDRASAEQELEWPRTDATDANGTEYSVDSWPTRLVRAVRDQVFDDAVTGKLGASATVDPVNPDLSNGNLKRKKIGPIEKEYFAATETSETLTSIDRFAPIVRNLLMPLLRSSVVEESASEWGTSCARRAS